MSLTTQDLAEIRNVVQDVTRHELTPLEARLEAIENDVKEIYYMLSDYRKRLEDVEAATV